MIFKIWMTLAVLNLSMVASVLMFGEVEVKRGIVYFFALVFRVLCVAFLISSIALIWSY